MHSKLPTPIIDRPKQAYRSPSVASFYSNMPEYLSDILSDERLRDYGIFNPASVKQLIGKIKSGKQLSEVDNMAITGILSTHLLIYQFISNRRKFTSDIELKYKIRKVNQSQIDQKN
jgi:asparagine synthase (glutamine-hydrolysing)